MKVYSYTDGKFHSAKGLFNDDSPVPFQEGFSRFYRNYYNNSVNIIYSAKSEAYIPIRYIKLKIFRFAQILHAPVRANEELNAEEQQELFEELLEFHREKQLCQRFIQPHPSALLQAVPEGAHSCRFGTYITHLDRFTDEELLHHFDTKYRKSVNHAARNGAEVRFGRECFEDFYALYKNTTEKAGIHCDPEKYFQALYNNLAENQIETGVVYDQGQPIGAVFLLYTKYSALCTHAGSGGESRLYGAMKLLHYETMKRLKHKGVRMYDLVGVRINSSNESLDGIFRFKKGFGGELKEGYLWKMDVAPLQSRMFDIMMRLRYRNQSMKDIIDEETN